MKQIGIIGYGVLGQQILNFIKESESEISEIIVFDDFVKEENGFIIKPFDSYLDNEYIEMFFYICVGYKHLHKRNVIINELLSKNRNVQTFIHKTCYISPSAKIGVACIFFPFVNIDQNVKISNGCIFHNNVVVSHDTVIYNCNYLSPGVVLCGNVLIKENCFLGAGSIVSNSIIINENVLVGIGTIVSKNINKYESVIGNPMKVLKNKLKIE